MYENVKIECVKIVKMECMISFNNGLYEICKNAYHKCMKNLNNGLYEICEK